MKVLNTLVVVQKQESNKVFLKVNFPFMHACIAFSEINLAVDSYQLGYWLTYPSLALFIASSTICIFQKKKRGKLG